MSFVLCGVYTPPDDKNLKAPDKTEILDAQNLKNQKETNIAKQDKYDCSRIKVRARRLNGSIDFQALIIDHRNCRRREIPWHASCFPGVLQTVNLNRSARRCTQRFLCMLLCAGQKW